MKTKKSELILLSAALFVLLFSACGNKEPEVELLWKNINLKMTDYVLR